MKSWPVDPQCLDVQQIEPPNCLVMVTARNISPTNTHTAGMISMLHFCNRRKRTSTGALQRSCFFQLAFLSGILLSFIQPAAADHYDCYVLAGQSNMDGRGQNSDLSKADVKSVKKAIMFYNNPPLTTPNWTSLAPGYSRPPKYRGKLPSPTFGPEIGFTLHMQKQRPKHKIAIIKASEGGTNLRKDWLISQSKKFSEHGHCYRNLIETIRTSTQKLKAEGHTFTIQAMLWHQGESDSKADPKTHQKRLTNLIATVREDCGVPNLPVVLGQVVDNGRRDKVRTAIKATSKAVANVGLVTVENLTTWDPGTHFDAASQLKLGQRFADEALRLINAGQPAVNNAANNQVNKVVCFGDSITKRGYPEILARELNCEVINAGVAGHTSRQGLQRMKKDVLNHRPTTVVILFGTNDLRVDSHKHVAVKDYSTNLSQMVTACEKINSSVILCTIPPIKDGPYFSRHKQEDYEAAGGLQFLVKGYCEAAMTFAKQEELPLVDFQTLLKSTPEWMHSDGVHPTGQGNQIIAQHIASTIKQTAP